MKAIAERVGSRDRITLAGWDVEGVSVAGQVCCVPLTTRYQTLAASRGSRPGVLHMPMQCNAAFFPVTVWSVTIHLGISYC